MTPFELTLRNELDLERQRFVNKWLFPWHNINIPNRVVEVEDFRGGKFSVGGVLFEGQIQELYWMAIGRYLVQEVHGTIDRWGEQTKSYPAQTRLSSLDGTAILLRQFAATIIKSSVDTDRRLRGKGFPKNVWPYDASREHSHANAEIVRLVEAHKSIIEARTAKSATPVQWVEAFGSKHQYTVAILALLATIVLGVLTLLVA